MNFVLSFKVFSLRANSFTLKYWIHKKKRIKKEKLYKIIQKFQKVMKFIPKTFCRRKNNSPSFGHG